MTFVKAGRPAHHTMSKTDARYTEMARSSKERCKLCVMFRPPHGCTLVKGNIEPDGVCRYFEAKK